MVSTYDPLWLERAMKEARVQTGQLAQASGVSRSQIQRIRKGMAPRMDTHAALRHALEGLKAKPTARVA